MTDVADAPLASAGVTQPDILVLDADDNLLPIDYDMFAGGSGYRVRKISGCTIYHGGSQCNYLPRLNDLPGQLRVAADGSLLLSCQNIVNRISGGKLAPLAAWNDDTEGHSSNGQDAAARYHLPGRTVSPSRPAARYCAWCCRNGSILEVLVVDGAVADALVQLRQAGVEVVADGGVAKHRAVVVGVGAGEAVLIHRRHHEARLALLEQARVVLEDAAVAQHHLVAAQRQQLRLCLLAVVLDIVAALDQRLQPQRVARSRADKGVHAVALQVLRPADLQPAAGQRVKHIVVDDRRRAVVAAVARHVLADVHHDR